MVEAAVQIPTLQRQRCRLRELRPLDAGSLQRHADDEAVWRNMFEGFPSPYLQADAEAWCSGGWRDGGHVWGIEVDEQIIGCVGFQAQAGWLRCNAEIGYWIGQAFWRRGISSEALGLVTEWAWAHQPELSRLCAGIFAWNEASQAVARKAGYQLEARLPQSAFKAGRLIDRVVWASYRNPASPVSSGAVTMPT
ncbi:GNAT family N-acetyltransferase [Paucibacter sp. TC2R-5]|uniref:GNAT family N-acetyltransferase n=1 Tax=Paucibacter sp. TC2R-5 TaxID=2893555 RepID=UPI0021E46741|nr:GNAT family N-acetyltransferase [Paucibacter sp. TC2R-5]MCV2360147.1 GNAT family N-acetyltransferase [Paucibacter sp. TC2R-5]